MGRSMALGVRVGVGGCPVQGQGQRLGEDPHCRWMVVLKERHHTTGYLLSLSHNCVFTMLPLFKVKKKKKNHKLLPCQHVTFKEIVDKAPL